METFWEIRDLKHTTLLLHFAAMRNTRRISYIYYKLSFVLTKVMNTGLIIEFTGVM